MPNAPIRGLHPDPWSHASLNQGHKSPWRCNLAVSAITAAWLAAPASAQFSTSLHGTVIAGSQQGLAQTFTDVPSASLSNLHQQDEMLNDALAEGSFTTPGGSATLSTHACSGGAPGFYGPAQGSAGALVDVYYRISAPTLPPGTPISVAMNWAMTSRVTAVGDGVINVMDSGQASAAGVVAFFVNDTSFVSLSGSYSRQIGAVISFGDLNMRGDSHAYAITVPLGQTIRVRMVGELSANTFAFGPASTDGDAQLSMLWGVTSLTPGATIVLYGNPDEPAPPADMATIGHAIDTLPPRPMGVLPCFRIPAQPAGATICPAATATFSVGALGDGPFTYQWQWRAPTINPAWSDVAEGLNADPFGRPVFIATGATSPSIDFSIAPGTPYSYPDWNAISLRVVVGNDCGDLTSEAATLTVSAPPFISEQPTGTRACPSGSAAFAVTAGGTGPFTYQWRMNSVPIPVGVNPSAATATLTLLNVRPADAGPYDCIVSNACASVTSDPAMLTICAADVNCDGTTNSQDFFDFLTAFFTTAPAADFNHDDAVNSQDFFDFLSAFFTGCP